MKVAEALQQATKTLAAEPAVAAQAARDAELLLLHVLDAERAEIFSHPERELSAEQELKYAAMIRERVAAKPIQYIVGEQEFYALPMRVTRDVLIPRPETEHLVEAALQRLPHDCNISVADVGTGSGAIAVALAHTLPMTHVVALDISAAALEVAKHNAERHGVAARVELVGSDLLGAVRGRCFDAIVSNPPYIALGEREQLHPQVREFEPGLALFAGESGLEIYERLIPQAWDALKSGGWLMMEIGAGQKEEIAVLLQGWSEVDFIPDLQGIARVAVARRS